jgi:hypothetical protein
MPRYQRLACTCAAGTGEKRPTKEQKRPNREQKRPTALSTARLYLRCTRAAFCWKIKEKKSVNSSARLLPALHPLTGPTKEQKKPTKQQKRHTKDQKRHTKEQKRPTKDQKRTY